MSKSNIGKIIVFILCLLPWSSWGRECHFCHQRISGQYFHASGNDFCSRECFLETLPKCSVCDKPCEQMYTMQDRNFCSRECMQEIYKCSVCQRGAEQIYSLSNDYGQEKLFCSQCRSLPKCYYCSFPNNQRTLPDGRQICRDCRSSAVTDQREIQRIFNHLRSELARIYGYDKHHRIELHIVDLRELHRQTPAAQHGGGNQLGLMKYSKREEVRRRGGREERVIVEENCHIYILNTMPRMILINTIVHELTHDYIRHNIGEVRDKTSEEGFCELIASLYNIRIGNSILNRAKEASRDPVYGGGYRRMRDIYRRNNRSFRRTLQSVR